MRLSGERAEAAGVVEELMPKVGTSDELRSRLSGLPLYRFLSPHVLACLGSPLLNVYFAGTHLMRLLHCRGQPYQSRMPEMDVKQLRIADTYSCRVIKAPSKSEERNDGQGVFAA